MYSKMSQVCAVYVYFIISKLLERSKPNVIDWDIHFGHNPRILINISIKRVCKVTYIFTVDILRPNKSGSYAVHELLLGWCLSKRTNEVRNCTVIRVSCSWSSIMTK